VLRKETLNERIEAEQKRKKIQRFFGTQKKTYPGPDGSNASGWRARCDGALQRAVAARPLERTRGMRIWIGECIHWRECIVHRGGEFIGKYTGDSVGQFRRYRCSPLFNYNCNLSLCGTFLHKLLAFPENCGLLPTPKETYHLNLSAVTLCIWSFRTPTSIFCTKELYNPGLPPFFFARPPSPPVNR